ncbi:unnamed protein product, partial [Meganyctiphanes norvegica]
MELSCAVQQYAWGVMGGDSSVAQMAQAGLPDFTVQQDKPYAELWMGTHPNGPAVIKGSKQSLGEYISQHPEVLGASVRKIFGDQLPFLFKVLSVNKALSIQAHPNKAHAEQLHSDRPDVYKDPNHKPEMTLALTPFEALCGFRPHQEIQHFIKEIPELKSVLGEDVASAFSSSPNEDNLKSCFSNMMNASKDTIAGALTKLQQKFAGMAECDGDGLLKELFLRLHQQYPGDVGCFSIYLLNYLTLQPGEAMFLGPNVIHAYLLGDCVECMACSDNVVRAGLTPKYQDVETLVSMLEYSMATKESRKFQGSKIDDSTTLYNPPVPDFAVDIIKVSSNSSHTLRAVDSASIFIVVVGGASVTSIIPDCESNSVSELQRGSVVFMKAGQTLALNTKQDFVAYRALCVL